MIELEVSVLFGRNTKGERPPKQQWSVVAGAYPLPRDEIKGCATPQPLLNTMIGGVETGPRTVPERGRQVQRQTTWGASKSMVVAKPCIK